MNSFEELYDDVYENQDDFSAPLQSLAKIDFAKKVFPAAKYKTWLEEQVEPYTHYFTWDNNKLESQKKAFWIAVWRHEKTKPSGSVLRILEWAREKKLHVMQVVKVLSR